MAQGRGQVTLEDVATLSGVSRSTASRALRGQPGVADEVRERVERIAKSLDYRPNRAAQNLAGARMSVIALIMGSTDLGGSVYAAKIVGAMARAAAARRHGLMLYLSSDEPGDSLDGLLRDGIVDGVLVRSVVTGETWVEALLDADIPTVLLGEHPGRVDIHSVDLENLESSADMVGHLLDTGCSRVGMVTGPHDRPDSNVRVQGYRLAHDRRNLPVDDALIVLGNYEYALGYAGAMTLAQAGVDGIFAANDLSGLGVMAALQEEGISVPDDVSVVGFDGTESSGLSTFNLTTMVQPFDDLADLAFDSVLALINGEPVPLTQLVKPMMRQGTTSRQIAG